MSNDLLTLINTANSTLDRYARVDELIKELSKEKSVLKKQILAKMGDNDKLIDGDHVAIIRTSERTSINTKALYAEFGEDAVKELYGKTTEVRTLIVK